MGCNPTADFKRPPRKGEPQLFGAVLNSLAGILHILAKAVGRVAARAGEGHKCGDEQ